MITDNPRRQEWYVPESNYKVSRQWNCRVIQLWEEDTPDNYHMYDMIIYNYKSWYYDWEWEALLVKDWKFYNCDLSHCSCNWPWDNTVYPWEASQELMDVYYKFTWTHNINDYED